MAKRIFKFVIACLIYLQLIQLVVLVVIRLPLLMVNPLGYLLVIGTNTLYLWFFSIIYRFKLSGQEDLNNLFWKLPFKISQHVGLKPKLERKHFLFYFLFTILFSGTTGYLKVEHSVFNDIFNITGLISLGVFFLWRQNKSKS